MMVFINILENRHIKWVKESWTYSTYIIMDDMYKPNSDERVDVLKDKVTILKYDYIIIFIL